MNPESWDFHLVEGTRYRAEHGQINPTGAPLAGGGVVGKDDWLSVVAAAHGKPSTEEIARKRAREQLFLTEMPKRDPISDAKSAAARSDWRLYMGIWAPHGLPGEPAAAPLHFAAWGLENVFGCQLSEEQFRANARRTWFAYYDVQNKLRMYVPGRNSDGKVVAFGSNGNFDFALYEHKLTSELFFNTNTHEYHAVYNRTLYSLALSHGHVYALPTRRDNPCLRDFTPV